jgi:outer membrane protein assembly factor BamA
VLTRYTINRISFSIAKASGSIDRKADSIFYDSVLIVSDGLILKPAVLTGSLQFHSGDLYTTDAYQRTINHLNNLGIFKYVNINYEQAGKDSTADLLDVRIYLLVADNVNLDVETNLVTKSNGFSGPAVSGSVTHINAFKGAEKLQIKLNGSFEWQWHKSEASLALII